MKQGSRASYISNAPGVLRVAARGLKRHNVRNVASRVMCSYFFDPLSRKPHFRLRALRAKLHFTHNGEGSK